MKKKLLNVVLLSTCILLSGVVFVKGLAESSQIEWDQRAFATETSTIIEDSVSRTDREDWFYIENVQPGLMTLEVSWGNSYDLDCYISTSASTSTYLARGYTTANPESCSYVITTAGTYYVGIRMYSWWSSTTAYTATVTWFADDGTSDTTPPTVDITAPSNGATVSDTISITATASDNVGIDYLQCNVDGGTWTQDTTSPYSWTLDTTSLTDGAHTINVQAYDAAGNYATDSVSVTVANGGPVTNELTSGVTVTGSLAAQYDTEMWFIQVGASALSMRTVLTCGSADFDVYGRLGAEPTTSTYDWRGYTSGGEDVTFNSPGEGTWYIMVRSYSGTGSYELTVTIEEEEPPNPDAEKIAVFFWASDAGAQWVIDEYWSVLQAEGYTKLFNFEDTTNFQADFNTVDAYEGVEDTVFFYLFGHGNNNGADSYTAFRPSGSFVYSSDLRTMFDALEAERVGYLIESCHSGGFPEDFHASPYLAMSTSDADHNAYAVGSLPNEGIFSNAFWNHVQAGYNAVDSFNYAEQVVFDGAGGTDTYMQYPQIADYSSYVWFA